MSQNKDPMKDLRIAGGDGPTLKIAILVGPTFAVADMIGVHTVFGIVSNVDLRLVWKNKDPLLGIPNFPSQATSTFAECPEELDLLHVPAIASPDVMEDSEVLAFLADRGSRARWVSGVCGGSLVLGAAGLLKGYRATTNFHMHDQLAYYGATPTKGNVVIDRNRVTAGPVSGGFDLALMLLGRLRGEQVAREVELQIEWAPEPPFGTGRPDLAGPELVNQALRSTAPGTELFRQVGIRAARRLGITVPSLA